MKVIDIHLHGGFGICFDNINQTKLEEFQALAFEKEIEAFCPTLTGDTPQNLREKLKIIKDVKLRQNKKTSKIIGVNLEGTFLSPKKPGVQNPNVFLKPTIENFKKIADGIEDIVKIVVIAPETMDNYDLINYLKSKNIKVHFGHTISSSIDKADGICHLYNAMEQLTHKKSTLQSKALVDENIYTELIADTIHVNEDILKITFKVRPKNKIILISDALPVASSNLEYCIFCNKKVYKTGLDENGTLGGSIKLLPDIVQNLSDKKLLTKDEIELMAYKNIKNYLKID